MSSEQKTLSDTASDIQNSPQSDQEWKEVKLEEVCDITTGKLNAGDAVEDGDYPFFTCDPETKRIDSYSFDTEAVLLAGNNANGEFNVKHYEGKFDAYQRTYVVTSTDEEVLDNRYLYYAINLKLNFLKAQSVGTATQYLTMTILNDIELKLPPIETQKKIIEILGSLDDKIGVNESTNEILEEIAQTLFKSWFVDFEPYNDFKNSELGKIPASFEVVELAEIVDLNRGYSYSSDYLDKENKEEKNYPMVNLQNIEEGGGFKEKGLKYYTKEDLKDRYKVKESDLIIAITEQTLDGELIGSPALIPPLFDDYNRIIMSQDVCQLSPKDERTTREFLYGLTKENRFRNYSESHSSGTTVYHLKLDSVESFEFALPPKSEIDRFTEILRNLISLKHSKMIENKQLQEQRDTLLPKLMSGEIKVKVNGDE